MIPVIVLTGFLGSGKTTLLNRLFRARPAGRGRFAIVVNELGSVGIDADLLPAGQTRQVELPGGCVCCALVEDLERTLLELVADAPDLEHIILETTGVADPMPISWTLASDRMRGHVRLAAVVTVVDPHEHERVRPLSPAVDAQVRYADLLVISKLDRAPAPEGLAAALREVNEVAPLIQLAPAEVPAAMWAYIDDPALADGRAGQIPSEAATHPHARGGVGFDSVAVDAPGVYDLEDLVGALEQLPASVVRVKGIVWAIDGEAGATEPAMFVVHRVGARVSTEPYAGETAPRVIAIGRELDSSSLATCLVAAVVTSDLG